LAGILILPCLESFGKLYDAPLYLYGWEIVRLLGSLDQNCLAGAFLLCNKELLYLVLQREDFEKLAYARRRVSLQFSLSA
jgi:hypothetical protein